MKQFIATLLVFSVLTAKGMSIRSALGQIESADNDKAVGASGEVSRFQIKPQIWARFSKSKNYTDPDCAWGVAHAILAGRINNFVLHRHRTPTPFEIYVLWNAPAQIANPSHAVKDRATRFANLISKQ